MTEKKPDIILLLVTLLLVTAGTVMIYSSSSVIAVERFGDGYYFLKKQMLFVVLGLGVMIILSRIPYYYLRKVAYFSILFSVVLLSLLLIRGFGTRVGGATRWLDLGVFSFQVTELVKVSLVLFLAHFLTRKEKHIREFSRGFLPPLTITFIIIGLILLQPDFGTAAIMAMILISMLYLAGSRILHLTGFAALLIPAGFVLVVQKGYRVERLISFLDPWKDPTNSGFQIIQSFLSFGSGGMLGVGLGNSMQKLFYLPEPHTDFILSVIAEESGFIGVTIIILLFVIFVLRGFMISYKAPDLFGTLLASGLTIIIALEAFVNMAAVMGLIPTKGLVLPFLSYGGTSLIMSLATVGVLLNISSYRG
ncbi:MAG: putative lipid II flippase FtsW [Thermodesulfobacteriota bacterium]|nr:putative lipid II flippase FtsW [Thermodesulfobacteriota bacterium]